MWSAILVHLEEGPRSPSLMGRHIQSLKESTSLGTQFAVHTAGVLRMISPLPRMDASPTSPTPAHIGSLICPPIAWWQLLILRPTQTVMEDRIVLTNKRSASLRMAASPTSPTSPLYQVRRISPSSTFEQIE